jgi:hypothetical protein
MVIRVTDETTKAEIEESLRHLAAYAAHQLHHPDCKPWRTAHERIDALLDDWRRAPSDTPAQLNLNKGSGSVYSLPQ